MFRAEKFLIVKEKYHIIKVVLTHDTLSASRKLQSQILVLRKHNAPKQLHPTLPKKRKEKKSSIILRNQIKPNLKIKKLEVPEGNEGREWGSWCPNP